ncbi:nucleoside phosphorylase domain-containing protein [Diaporthe sp. PMI_573]|nr:nucleoside phosphorylase domain-containing protein [Diaporthaceae sp. PMI_573]
MGCRLKPQHRNDFKIAIICALTLETDAVQDVFDQRWDEVKYGKMAGDPNQYTMGVIGRHHVIVVHMPGMGKSNGASVAANCRASFPNLGLVLVVGICGGVPFTRSGVEIILGDIIVSDGLIQYDFGRQFPDRFVRMSETISKPNAEILSFLNKTKGRWWTNRLKDRTALHLKYLSNSTELGGIAEYPGACRDKLYEATYRHKHQAAFNCEVCNRCQTKKDPVCKAALTLDCESLQCDDRHLVDRKRLVGAADESETKKNHADPSIHFGLYASGDKVMKSGEEREIIAKDEGVMAFEMEGSGVWEGFPGRCLVVKAVCDYADSHKNKRWQSYAAASAAAFTKAFLEAWYT